MDNITYKIQQQTFKSEKETKQWLKEQGMNTQHFVEIPLHLLQAQKIATNILKNYAIHLRQNEVHSLKNFLAAMRNRKKRARLTATQTFKIMNIGNTVNRKLFKAN